MEFLIELFGEGLLLFAIGGLVGLLFGFASYRCRFCLRAATLELAEGRLGPRLATWLLAVTVAVVAVQGARSLEWIDVSSARQLADTGRLSDAILGGLVFGADGVLSRGCASRLLVLSASGNLRAIVTGLVLTLTAQASLTGILAPGR